MEVDIEPFDFDSWAALAETAPEIFEERRRECVEQLISEGADTRRLRGLQSRIDMERLRARTAMSACLRLSALMWDSLLDCQVAVNTFIYKSPSAVRAFMRPRRQAKIIRFHPRHDAMGKF